jgi:hypothetical protein
MTLSIADRQLAAAKQTKTRRDMHATSDQYQLSVDRRARARRREDGLVGVYLGRMPAPPVPMQAGQRRRPVSPRPIEREKKKSACFNSGWRPRSEAEAGKSARGRLRATGSGTRGHRPNGQRRRCVCVRARAVPSLVSVPEAN